MPLREFLEIPYDQIEEVNLAAKSDRVARKDPGQIREAPMKYLTDEKQLKALTVCFTHLEGRLHMLDYDKKFLLKSADNLTFDGSSIRGFSRQAESDLRLGIDWPAFYWLPADVFGPGKVLVFGDTTSFFNNNFVHSYELLRACLSWCGEARGYAWLNSRTAGAKLPNRVVVGHLLNSETGEVLVLVVREASRHGVDDGQPVSPDVAVVGEQPRVEMGQARRCGEQHEEQGKVRFEGDTRAGQERDRDRVGADADRTVVARDRCGVRAAQPAHIQKHRVDEQLAQEARGQATREMSLDIDVAEDIRQLRELEAAVVIDEDSHVDLLSARRDGYHERQYDTDRETPVHRSSRSP